MTKQEKTNQPTNQPSLTHLLVMEKPAPEKNTNLSKMICGKCLASATRPTWSKAATYLVLAQLKSPDKQRQTHNASKQDWMNILEG